VHWTGPSSQELLHVSRRFITGISQLYENGMLNRSKNKLKDVHAFYKSTYYYNCRVMNHILLHILFLTLYFDYFENIIRTEDELSGLFIILHNEELYSLQSSQVVRVLKQTSPWVDHVSWARNAYIILTRKPFGSRRLVHNIKTDWARFRGWERFWTWLRILLSERTNTTFP
jgi:hypothetical protein